MKAIFTVKIVLAPIVGLICGLLGIQGYIGFLLFFALTGGFGVLFVVYYGLTDLNEEMNYGDGFNEGLGASFAEFLLTWIVTFTWIYN